MHNIYLLQKFVLDHTVMLATNSRLVLSAKSDTILYYMGLSFTTWAIRNSFFSENQEYTPFIESDNYKDRTCQ